MVVLLPQVAAWTSAYRLASPSAKLTWQWKMDLLKMYSRLKMGMFQPAIVSLPECNIGDIPTMVVGGRVDYGEIRLKRSAPTFFPRSRGGPDVCLGIKYFSVWFPPPSLVLI